MSIRVLLVDDSVAIHDLACQLVGVTADVGPARTLTRSSAPDVITLDRAMPGFDGLQFLHALDGRSHPRVVVSSNAKPGTRAADEALDAGAAACFDKATLLSDLPRFVRILQKSAATKGSSTPLDVQPARKEPQHPRSKPRK